MNNEHSAMQAFFDKATKGVLAQGRPAVTNGSCKYRWRIEGMPTLACAIGQCLTDEQIAKYKIKEGDTPAPVNPNHTGFPVALVAELLPGVDYDHAIKFMSALQGCHDSLSEHDKGFAAKFTTACNAVAVEFGLNPIE